MKVITVTNLPHLAQPLVNSLEKQGWDYECIVIPEWRGFGSKLIAVYEYLKANPGVKEFIFCDAHDVVCLSGVGEFASKVAFMGDADMIVSGERGLWPPPLIPFRSRYTKTEMGFDYINSGCYYAKSESFINIFEKYPPFYEIDDQAWLNMIYLCDDEFIIKIDTAQCAFNSHSFIREGEYRYINNRVCIGDGSIPVFIHGNGGGLPQQVYDLIK